MLNRHYPFLYNVSNSDKSLLCNKLYNYGNIIIRDEVKGFVKFRNVKDLCKYINEEKKINKKYLHEVMLEFVPNKLRFDIDCDLNQLILISKFLNIKKKIKKFINWLKLNLNLNTLDLNEKIQSSKSLRYLEQILVCALNKSIKQTYRDTDISINMENINEIIENDDNLIENLRPLIFYSHGITKSINHNIPHKFKFSLHVQYNIGLSNSSETKELSNKIIDNLPEELKCIFDRGIYKKTSNFRLLFSTKKNSSRMKLKRTYNEVFTKKAEWNNSTDINFDECLNSLVNIDSDLIWPSSLLKSVEANRKLIDYNRDIDPYTYLAISLNLFDVDYHKYISKNKPSNNRLNNCSLTSNQIKKIKTLMPGCDIIGNRLSRFNRGLCCICNVIHENDNGYLSMYQDKIYIGCFRSIHYNKKYITKCIDLNNHSLNNSNNYTLESNPDLNISKNINNFINIPKINLDNLASINNKLVKLKINSNTLEVNQRYITEDIYKKNIINNNLLFIKSGTGSGKSYSLRNYLINLNNNNSIDLSDNLPNNSSLNHIPFNNPPRIIFITYRTSLADEIYSKYKDYGFQHYKNIKKNMNEVPRLIIQVESLYKLRFIKHKYDYVILDEVCKTMEQLDSPLGNSILLRRCLFMSILQADKIIAIDAFLDNRTINSLIQYKYSISNELLDINNINLSNNINSPLDTLKFKVIINNYKHKTDRTYIEIKDKNKLKAKVCNSINRGNKVFICANSKNFIIQLKEYLEEKCKDKVIKIFHGESSAETKEELGAINKTWKVDVLMYTSVIESGNSFDIEWFDEGFCYFTNRSTNHLGCLQMMDRIRNIKNQKIYFNINHIKYNRLILNDNTYNAYISNIETKLKLATYAASNNVHKMGLLYVQSENNINYINQDPSYYGFLRNVAFNEMSRDYFRELLLTCWNNQGIKIETIEHLEYLKNNKLKNNKILNKHVNIKSNKTIISNVNINNSELKDIKGFTVKKEYKKLLNLRNEDCLLNSSYNTLHKSNTEKINLISLNSSSNKVYNSEKGLESYLHEYTNVNQSNILENINTYLERSEIKIDKKDFNNTSLNNTLIGNISNVNNITDNKDNLYIKNNISELLENKANLSQYNELSYNELSVDKDLMSRIKIKLKESEIENLLKIKITEENYNSVDPITKRLTRHKLDILNTYQIEEQDLTKQFIVLHGSYKAMKRHTNRLELLKLDNISEYKTNTLLEYKQNINDYANLRELYSKSIFVKYFIIIDIIEKLINKSLIQFLKEDEDIEVSLDHVNSSIDFIREKVRILNKVGNYRYNTKFTRPTRIINNIISEFLGIKLQRKNGKGKNYKVQIIRFKK